MATTEDVRRIAREAGEAGDANKGVYIPAGYGPMNLRATGWCTRFVRQVHEAALGLEYRLAGPYPWEYAAPNAIELEARLKAGGCKVDDPEPGDVICINRNSGEFGHVGIYLGGGKLAENTSSKSRGPGTTISDLNDVANRITDVYRAVPLAEAKELKVVFDGEVIDCDPLIMDGVTRIDLTPFANALGYDTFYRPDVEQGPRVYVKPSEED